MYVVDSDGAGERQVSDAGLVALARVVPRWRDTISYSVLGSRGWSIVTKDLEWRCGAHPSSTTTGLNTTPAFSPEWQLARLLAR